MDLQEKLKQHIRVNFPFIQKDSLLYVAFSGGLDSSVLLHLLHTLRYRVAALHCNFHLRGDESNRDENFVRSTCSSFQIHIDVLQADAHAISTEKKISVQEAAREIRYHWFHEKLKAQPGSFLATAHHSDDTVETFLINCSRGTGIRGLLGIPAIQGRIIRPLLPFTRRELEAYAAANQLQWVDDSSNESDYYTRNFIRNQVIPLLTEKFPQAGKNISQTISHLQDAALLYQQAIDLHLHKLRIEKGNEVHIPVLQLLKSKPVETILWEMIKQFGFSAAQLNDVLHLCEAANGAYVASSSHRIIRNRKWLIIAPLESKEALHILIEKNDTTIISLPGKLELQIKPAALPAHPDENIACINLKQIAFPLLLRPWKTGDYFYPLGMTKKKKISRFLIDLKLSPTAKEKVWVLESNKKILWVIGYRIDNRCKLEADSTEMLQLKWTKIETNL